MGDLGPLKKLFSNPQLISAGMELAKNDGKSLPDKMVALMKTNPELAKTIMEAFKDPEVKSALDKVMQDEQVKKKVMPVVDQFVKEVVGK